MTHSTVRALRALILFNPKAGQAIALYPQLEAAAQLWREAGWTVDLCPTRCAGDATVQAREAAAAGYDLVTAAGGDGTVNEVVNGLVGSDTALAVLPCGTVNIWAREMGLSMDIGQAAAAFLGAERRLLDLGLCYPCKDKRTRKKEKRQAKKRQKARADAPEFALQAEPRVGLADEPRAASQTPSQAPFQAEEQRYFLLMASAGFDAAVTAEVDLGEKRRFGAIAYLKSAFDLAWNYRGTKTKIFIDGKRIRGRVLMVVIGNSQLYGGVVKFTAHALVDDGLLDVCVIKGRSLLIAPLRLFSVFARFYNVDSQVRYFRARQVEIRSKKKKKRLPVQVDGDYLGQTPMTFAAVPHRLWAMVPSGCDPTLWSRSDWSDQVEKTLQTAS